MQVDLSKEHINEIYGALITCVSTKKAALNVAKVELTTLASSEADLQKELLDHISWLEDELGRLVPTFSHIQAISVKAGSSFE